MICSLRSDQGDDSFLWKKNYENFHGKSRNISTNETIVIFESDDKKLSSPWV
jgi:hypothetical protein